MPRHVKKTANILLRDLSPSDQTSIANLSKYLDKKAHTHSVLYAALNFEKVCKERDTLRRELGQLEVVLEEHTENQQKFKEVLQFMMPGFMPDKPLKSKQKSIKIEDDE